MRGIALCTLIIILYAEYSSAAPRRSPRGCRHANESSVALSGAVASAVSTRIQNGGKSFKALAHYTQNAKIFLNKSL